MTDPDRAAFVAKVRDAIEQAINEDNVFGRDAFSGHILHVEGTWIDSTEVAEAAIAAMAEHMGPMF